MARRSRYATLRSARDIALGVLAGGLILATASSGLVVAFVAYLLE